MFQRNYRDFCAEEAPVTKLSSHFTQNSDLNSFNKTESINGSAAFVPNSFHMGELLNQVNNTPIGSLNVTPVSHEQCDGSKKEINNNRNNFNSNPLFHPLPLYSIPTNTPQLNSLQNNNFSAEIWAKSELSQFDDKIISLEDLSKMKNKAEIDAKVRFTDVVRQMAVEDEDKFDEELRQMRSHIFTNTNSADIWNNMEETLKMWGGNKEKDYPTTINFQQNNPYLNKNANSSEKETESNIDEILKKGIEFYNKGYFSQATEAFEAVVQLDPASEKGWSYLGLSYSENEQDTLAMTACLKSLELNKDNREVLLSIARVFCNEMNTEKTVQYLERWLLSHPKYRSLATVSQEAELTIPEEMLSSWDDAYEQMFRATNKYQILEQQLKTALQMDGSERDSELNIVCGTFYHAAQDYDKSALYFQRATEVIVDQPQLWNKLGTAYCNSGQLEKSIEGYNHALSLAPGFTRAACNLGVAYYNSENYEECIRQGLKALKIQQNNQSSEKSTATVSTSNNELLSDNSISVGNNSADSDPIWNLIKLACFKLNRPELDLSLFTQDIDTLSQHFRIQ